MATRKKRTPADFMKLMHPEGPWCMTAISLDRTGTETRTFFPDNEDQMQSWLDQYNGQRNLYFHVNSVKGNLTKKAKRENIKQVDYLHVDVDPEPGLKIEEEQERILALFTTDLPKGIPEPTMLVFSGGGYQAFWKLEEPIRVDGDLGLAEDAKLYNVQIERVFNADNCHNIDRLMRVAGTTNIPDEKKIKRGRQITQSAVMFHKPKNVYPISQFKKAAPVQQDGLGGGSSADQEVKISGNIEPILDIQFLREDPYNVSDTTVVAIAQGSDENNPKEGDNSRSAWVFHVACALVRAEVPDDMIFSILTDKGWGISESVLESKDPAKYAIRQISRAKQYAVDEDLMKLNDRYAVIRNFGGKCRVVEEIHDRATGTYELMKMTRADFENAWCHLSKEIMTPGGAPKFKPLGKWWFEHPKRRVFDRVVFEPSYTGLEDYNLWRGFKYAAIPGDCDLFLTHVRDNVCSGNAEHFDYLIKWMARAVQNPSTQGEVAVVLQGGRGTGKSFTAKVFGRLFGRHFKHVANAQHLVGNFNSHLRDCLVLFADEAFFAGDKRHESVLKTIITEDTLPIEAKGVDLEHVANYIHLIMASNSDHVIPAGKDERRFFVLEVGEGSKQNGAYFSAIAKQMENGGMEALLDYLLNVDLSDFDVRAVPQTDALKRQKSLSIDNKEDWWFQKLDAGLLLPNHTQWQRAVAFQELVDDYISNLTKMNSSRRGSFAEMGHFFKKMIPDYRRTNQIPRVMQQANVDIQFQEGTPMASQIVISNLPSLEKCRQRWEDMFGRTDWTEIDSGPTDEQGEIPF